MLRFTTVLKKTPGVVDLLCLMATQAVCKEAFLESCVLQLLVHDMHAADHPGMRNRRACLHMYSYTCLCCSPFWGHTCNSLIMYANIYGVVCITISMTCAEKGQAPSSLYLDAMYSPKKFLSVVTIAALNLAKITQANLV